MAVNVPPELDGLFYLVVGQPFPRLDVAGARAFAARLREVGARLEDLLQDGDAAGVAVGGALGGAAGDGVRRFVGRLTKLGPSMGTVARRNEEALRELALSEEKNGYEMLQELVLFFPQIMWALWSPWGVPWLPVLTAALRARLLPRLAKMESFALMTGRAMISEAASEVVQNANAQVLQFIERNRTSWDSMDSIVSAVAGGAAGGIMTAGMKAGQRYLGKHADTATFHGGLEGATEVVVDAGATGILGGDFDGLGTAFTSGAFSGGAQKAADDTGHVIAGKMNQPAGSNTPIDPTTATGSGFPNPALRKPGGAAAGTEGPRVERSGATKPGSEGPRIESPDEVARGGETLGSDMSVALPSTSSGSKTPVPNSPGTTTQVDDSSTEPEPQNAITTLPVVPIGTPVTPRVPQTWGKTELPVVSGATSRPMPQRDDVATISGGVASDDRSAQPIVPSSVSNPGSTVAEPEDTTFRATTPNVQFPGEPQQERRFASSPDVDEDALGNLNHQSPETEVPGPSGPWQLGDAPDISGVGDEHAPRESAPIDQNAPTADHVILQKSPAAGPPDAETVGAPLRTADLPSQNPMTRDLPGNNSAADQPDVVVPGKQGPGGGLSGTPATPQAGTGLLGQPATGVSPGLGSQPPNSAGQQPSNASPAGQSHSGRGETAGGSAVQRSAGAPAQGFPVVPVSLRQGLDSVSAPATFESTAQPSQQKAPLHAEQSADIHSGVPLSDRSPLTRASELPVEPALGHLPADEDISDGIVPNSGDQPVGRGPDLPELALGSGVVPHGYSRERLGNAPAHQRGRAHEIRESAGVVESSVVRPAFEIRRAGRGSHGVVELTVRINFEAAPGVDDTTRHRAVRDAQRAVDELRNKPNVRLSTGELLRFRIVPVEAGDRAHHTVVLDHDHKIDQNHWTPGQSGSRTAREIDHMLGVLNGDLTVVENVNLDDIRTARPSTRRLDGDPPVEVGDAGVETAERMLPVDLAQERLSPMAPPVADGSTEPAAQSQNTDDVGERSDVVSIDATQPAAELVHVQAHMPRDRAASGGLSVSSAVRNDGLYWDQLYSALPAQDTQPACFYVFVSATDGGFLVGHSLLDGASFAELVLSSPHYQRYGADPTNPLRVVGIDAESSAEFHEQVAVFAKALRGDGPSRTVEVATGELRVDETGQVVPLDGDYLVVSEFDPSEVSWTSLAGVDGHAFGSGLVLGEDRAAAFKRALGTYGPDRVMSLIGRKRQQGSDATTVVRELQPWAHGVLGNQAPPVGFILVMRDGKYLVPLEGGRLAAVSSRRMARVIVESPMYQKAKNRPVRGDLVLFISDDGADPAESGQAGAELRAALRAWDEDTWHGYDYAGEIEFDERGLVVPEGAVFAESSPLPAQELDRVLSDSVFGFPVTEEDRKSLRELADRAERGAGQQPPAGPAQKKPLLVAVHSPDGKVLRVRSSSGVTHELGWRQFGQTLLSDSAFRLALESDPDRPVRLLFVGAAEGTGSSLAVSEMVGPLHEEGFFNDVYAPAATSGWELVSGPRAGDLKWEVLHNRLGRPVAVYVRGDRDEERYSRAKEWAWNATPATLKSYEDGHHAANSPWSSTELPLFLLVETGAEGVRGLRRGVGDAAGPGQAQAATFTLEQFAKAMRSEPEFRKLLPRSGSRSLVLVPSGDSAVDGRTFTDVFSQGGYRRRVHLLTSGELTRDGRLTAHGAEILTFEPPVLKPDDVFSRALVDKDLGIVGQFFPLDDKDILSMPGEVRTSDSVRQMYFMQEVSPETTDEQGAVVPARFAPFLTSWAVEDKVAWTNSGHGGVDGFEFGTRTDSPWNIGDTVTLSGEHAAQIMYGSSVYTRTRPDPARPNVLLFCSVNEVADGASESEARKLGRQWRKVVSPEAVTHASTQVVFTMSAKPHAVKTGGFLTDVERSSRDSGGPVPLSDLVAERIASIEIDGAQRKLATADAERVREIARKVARAAAWRKRNGAGLPEVGIATERAATVFRAELVAEWARLGRFGRGLRPEDLAIRVGSPGRRPSATVSVELPKHVPGAREVRDATGPLKEITTARFSALEAAFVKLGHDDSAAVSGPVALRHSDVNPEGERTPGHEIGEWLAHSSGQITGEPWTDDEGSGSGDTSLVAQQSAEQPFVNTYEPFGDVASGALSLDYGARKDRGFWERVYSTSRRPGFAPTGTPPPFYLFVTWSGGLALVGDQVMGGAELAEFVRRSPHYQRYAGDRSVMVQIVGVQVGDNDLGQVMRTAREFATAERGRQDAFRLVRVATRSLDVGPDNRVVPLDDSALSMVSTVQADDLQTRPLVGEEGEPLGLYLGDGAVVEVANELRRVPSDLALKWVYERSLVGNGRAYLVPAWASAATGDRVRPVLVMLTVEGGSFKVPIPGQLAIKMSPASLARQIIRSQAFRSYRKQKVRPQLLVLGHTVSGDPDQGWDAVREFVRDLQLQEGRPWQTHLFAGDFSFGREGFALPHGSQIEAGPPLPTESIKLVTSASLFGFPLSRQDRDGMTALGVSVENSVFADDEPWNLIERTRGKKPIFLVANSPDGAYALIESQDNRRYEVDGAELAVILWNSSEFFTALSGDPDRPLILVGRDNGTLNDVKPLARQVSERLRRRDIGHFGDVYAAFSGSAAPEYALVSDLLGTDLEIELLPGRDGDTVAMHFSSGEGGDGEEIAEVRWWAREVTSDSLSGYQVELPHGDLTSAERRKISGWSTVQPPIFLFVSMRGQEFVVRRRDGEVFFLSAAKFSNALTLIPEISKMLRRHQGRPIVIASLSGEVGGGGRLAAELMHSGFSRTVFEARHGIRLVTGGRFTAILHTLVAHQPPEPRAGQIAWSPHSGDRYGQLGHTLNLRRFDVYARTIQARGDAPVRRQYYFRRLNDSIFDDEGRLFVPRRIVPYLSPQAVSDLPPYLWGGHGFRSGFAFSLKANNAMELGDTVLLGGEGAARLLVASDVYRTAQPDPRAPILFGCCWVANRGNKSPAADFSRQWRLLRGGKPLIAASNDIVLSALASSRHIRRGGAYRAFGDGQRDPEWEVPLLDLAATEIGPGFVGFDSRGEPDIGGADVLRRVGQRLARAAAWRALNGADMPTVVITGTMSTKQSSPSEAAHAVLGAEMIAEWGRLGRLARGLTIENVVFDLVNLPASERRTEWGTVVTVYLPPQALGQDEVTAVMSGRADYPSDKELDDLDKAFAKLVPSAHEAPPADEVVSAEGKEPRAKIVEPPVAVHDPSTFASGGLSFDAGASDLGHAERVARYAAMPPAAARPFYLFLTESDEGLHVNGTRVLPAVLVEIVKRSPHYQAFGSAVPVRVVGVNPADAEVRHFARLLRGRKGGFRLIEAAPAGSTVFQRISEVRSEDVAWLPLSHADGRVLGMSFDTPARQAGGTAATLMRASDESTRVVLEWRVDANGSEHVRPKIALWADTTDGARLRPFELLLDADGEKYVVPLISGEVVQVSPDEMAKLAYKSRWFGKAHGGSAQPDVVLITNDLGADPAAEHPGSRRLQARLRELGGPRRITAYAGPADHDATVRSLRVPEGARFEQTFSSRAETHFSLSANAVRKSVSPLTIASSGSVFAFPLPDQDQTRLRAFMTSVRTGTVSGLAGRKPLHVVADSPDGKHVRVALHGGRVLEVSGADFGRMLLTHPAFARELRSDPTRPIVLSMSHHPTSTNFGDAAYDFASALQEVGLYRDVYVRVEAEAHGGLALVSSLRDGDLQAEVLSNASGHPVALYFRSENDDSDYEAARTWALNATDEKLRRYQVESGDGVRTAHRSSWTEMPLFLIARSAIGGGYRGTRRDGETGTVTPEEFARVARAHPAMRQILGTNSSGRSIALVTPNGEAAGGRLVRDSLLQGGFLRPLSVATAGVTFEPDGTITVSRTALTELSALDPSDLAVENVVTHPRRPSLSVADGQYFPSELTDSYMMSRAVRNSSRRGYYVREELTAAARKNGTSETEYVAYLSPLAGIDGRPWVIDGHGSSEGFVVGLRTDRPWEIGDTTVIGGATMAKMVTGGALYREAGLPGDHPVLLLPCSINRGAAARDLMSSWHGGAATPSTVVGPTSVLLVHSGNGLQVTDSGGRITEVSPTDGDQTPLVPLADLAATQIEPVTVTFSSGANTGLQEQKDLVGTIARRAARAAAWRGVNGAGPVRVEITGYGTLGALSRGAKSGLDHANSAHSLFNEALHDEFAVLRRFGLDVALAQVDVQVLSAVATRDGGHTALIAVRLPERELGQRELRDLAGDVDTVAVTAVDKAFSRLSPESDDSVGEPSGGGTLVRRGPSGPVEHYDPAAGKAGGLGFDWDGSAITVRWARLYDSMPVSRNHTFDVFVTQHAGTFLVAGQHVDARTLARIVTASPHFIVHAADPSTAVRLVIAVDLGDQDRAKYTAEQFALALRGVGPFRSVEAAPVSVQVDQDGQVSLLKFGSASVVSSPRSEDVAWIPLTDVDGITFGMAFDTPKNRKDEVEKHSRALPAAIQLGIMRQAVIGANGGMTTESVVAPWASVSETDGVHTRTVLLLLESNAYGFKVPTTSNAVVDVAPDAMARLIYLSDIFTMFRNRQVLPTLLLMTANPDGDIPAGASAVQHAAIRQRATVATKLNANLLENLRFLSGLPWQSIDYVGTTVGHVGIRGVSSIKSFRMGPPPSLQDFPLIFEGTVVAFPSAAVLPDRMREVSVELARRASVNGASNRTPLEIVVDSPDGRVARLLTSSGVVVEVSGNQLGRMLLGHPEIQRALRHDPQRRWNVVGNLVGEKISHGGLAFDIAGAFRASGHFGEIMATTGKLELGRGSLASLDRADYEVVSKIRYGELAVASIPNSNGIDVLYVWSAGNRAGHQKAVDWAKHATRHTLAMYEVHAADGRVEMRQAPWVRPPLVVFVDAGVNGYDVLRLNGKYSTQKSASMIISPDDLARGLSGYSVLKKPVNPIDGRDLLLVSPNGVIGDGEQVGKSLMVLGRHVTVHEAPLSPAWRADGTLATAGQPMVKHLRPTPSPGNIIVHRVQRQHLPWAVTSVYSPGCTDDVINMSRSAHVNNVVQQEYYFKAQATNLVDAGRRPVLRYRAFLSPWAGIDAPSWSLIGHGVPEGFGFMLKTDVPTEFGDGVYLDGAIAARVLFGTDAYRRAQLDPDRPVVLRTCLVNALLPAGDTQAARFSDAVKNMRPQHDAKFFAANAVVNYGPETGYYSVHEPAFYGEAGESSVDAGDEVPLTDFVTTNIASAQIVLSVQGPQVTMPQSAVDVIRDMGRQVARAALWRKLNNVGMPVMTVTAKNKRLTNLATLALQNAMTVEWARRGRLGSGLTLQDVHVVEINYGVRSAQVETVRIKVDLPEHDLGETELAMNEYVFTEDSIAALNAKFARLAR